MKIWPAETLLLEHKADIRASGRFLRVRCSVRRRRNGLCLVVSDVLSITIAWKFAQFLNQFYSPLPSPFIWWTWLGFPSVFWLFVLSTLSLFAHHRLYSHTSAVKDYAKAAQLISYVYLASLVISYFYDPNLDLPRSLFFSAWFSSLTHRCYLQTTYQSIARSICKLINHRQPFS